MLFSIKKNPKIIKSAKVKFWDAEDLDDGVIRSDIGG